MPETKTRRSVKKSRSGCQRCKSQRIKCDEKQGACGRCERLGLKCPGYNQPLKWSTKHEVRLEPSDSLDYQADSGSQAFDWLELPLAQPSLSIVDNRMQSGVRPSPGLVATPAFDDLLQEDAPWNVSIISPQQEFENESQEKQLALSRSGPALQQPFLRSLGAQMAQTKNRIHPSLTHQPYELIACYFKVMPRIYSTFDSHKNPFRSAVSSLYSHSLAVNLAAQSMAAAYLAEVHPRFANLGMTLRQQCLEIIQKEASHSYDVLLALTMSAPTGNWHEPKDLGVPYFHIMLERLEAIASAGMLDANFYFFREAMILWEMFLAYTTDPDQLRVSLRLPRPVKQSSKMEPHPWTGVAGDTVQSVADVGRLLRRNRLRSRNQKFITQAWLQQMSQDLDDARELERQLLAYRHPDEKDIVNPDDSATPVWHLTTVAELHRYAGLIQLYRVFPDLLSERLQSESLLMDSFLTEFTDLMHSTPDITDHNDWLTNFAMEALQMLSTIPTDSGTKDFQPFLLVVFASELACESRQTSENDGADLLSLTHESNVGETFAKTALMRKFVVDRLTSFCRLIPPKPLRICLDIIKETWTRIDGGEQNVYWLDVMIEHGWETIMA